MTITGDAQVRSDGDVGSPVDAVSTRAVGLSLVDEPIAVVGTRPARAGSRLLRLGLLAVDIVAMVAAWSLALLVVSSGDRSLGASLLWVIALTVAGLVVLRQQGLYLARVSSVRADEVTRVLRGSILVAVGAGLAAELIHSEILVWECVVGGAALFVLLFIGRSIFRGWLGSQRAVGRFRRPVFIVGSNEEARHLVDLVRTHPETGLTVTGVFGDLGEAERNGLAGLYLGSLSEAASHAHTSQVTGVMVATSAVPHVRLNPIVRELEATGTHLHLTSGLRGVATRRLQTQAIAHEPMLYLQPPRLSPWQIAVKRALDITIAGIALVPAAPLILVCALVVRLQDGGPAFFRQARVGRHGEMFELLKIRSMVVDAEQQRASLASDNERTGPLFKVADDPRFTRFGRFLDVTSINELPQLWNVLRGEMSLVGPRPALPSEAEQFDPELHARFSVRPGITGLWQVEARDNPSFAAYRRLDLHYVDNWSVAFDLVILASTAEVVATRLVRSSKRAWRRSRRARARAAEVDVDAVPDTPPV